MKEYIAFDGTVFDSEADCLEYERKGTDPSTSKVRRSRQLFIQKLVGVGLLLFSILIFLAVLSGTNDADRDATPIILLAPLGAFLIFTKRIYLIF